MAIERLQKILSNAGVASRRVAEDMILEGRVAVNGRVFRELGDRADPELDEITVDGVPVNRGAYRYFALNKPAGFVTTADDEQGRETVLDLVPIGDVVLHPVGRLDMESEGLLILTNDGNLTKLLTHPSHEVEKEYLVGVDGPLAQADIQRMVRGVESDGERLRATSVRATSAPPADDSGEAQAGAAWLLMVLRQGKNREIRRMVAAIGREVTYLRRIRVGSLLLGPMSPGTFRELAEAEVLALYAAAKRPATPAQAPRRSVGPRPSGSGSRPKRGPGRR
ncbi:MAG: pseudouridine synthase [Dehalococcoidia bacterium]